MTSGAASASAVERAVTSSERDPSAAGLQPGMPGNNNNAVEEGHSRTQSEKRKLLNEAAMSRGVWWVRNDSRNRLLQRVWRCGQGKGSENATTMFSSGHSAQSMDVTSPTDDVTSTLKYKP